jgi:hypothetical protein
MKLKGLFYGVKIFKQYKTSDIINCVLLDQTYNINSIDIKVKNDEEGIKKIFMYHAFNSTNNNLNGRWYNTNIKDFNIEWNDNFYKIKYIIPEWDTNGGVLLNVPITITFTKNGFRKIKSVFF